MQDNPSRKILFLHIFKSLFSQVQCWKTLLYQFEVILLRVSKRKKNVKKKKQWQKLMNKTATKVLFLTTVTTNCTQKQSVIPFLKSVGRPKFEGQTEKLGSKGILKMITGCDFKPSQDLLLFPWKRNIIPASLVLAGPRKQNSWLKLNTSYWLWSQWSWNHYRLCLQARR